MTAAMTHIELLRPGLIPYAEAWELQRNLHQRALHEGISTLILCEHPPVYSLGSRGNTEHLLRSEREYAALGAELIHSDRGGDVTFHGPGQLVGYLIFRLADMPCGQDLHRFLRLLEAALIDALATLGVVAFTVEKKTGVWTSEGKIAAIGLRCARWVSMHGFALNVRTDLDWFSHIVPCGLHEPVTSLAALQARSEMPQVEQACLAAIGRHFCVAMREETGT